jgi:hypothetical protein
MEPEITELLSLNMVKGSRAGLKDMNSVLLTESVAKALFDNADPIGKIITIDSRLPVKVTGVYKDLPNNSSFANLLFIAPFQLLVKSENLEGRVNWGNSWFRILVQIADNTDMHTVSMRIRDSKKMMMRDLNR